MTPGLVMKWFLATAYCACAVCTGPSSPERGGHGLTRSGVYPVAGWTVACAPELTARRQLLWFPGRGLVQCEDTGRLVQSARRIDVFMESHEAALKFGRRRVRLAAVATPKEP